MKIYDKKDFSRHSEPDGEERAEILPAFDCSDCFADFHFPFNENKKTIIVA